MEQLSGGAEESYSAYLSMNKLEEKVKQFKIGLLKEGLEQCTSLQIEFFWRLYPNCKQDAANLHEEKLDSAIHLVERTMEKNNER